ncbi:aminotransferase class V-fold PLP-dependent enzyme [Wenzhouxiangella sp. XN24]|uniref:aminotransferase class V-fold PLP-dependent enzyme n=1 Tax=Wenzhouxiangella sp. XN24 TaxID=2713569 RepID=UPI00197F08B3
MSLTEAAPLDLDWVRSRFPALRSDWVLMDNAGGSTPLGAAVDRIAEYLRRWPVQLGASYTPSAEAGELQAEARAGLAGLFASGGGPVPSPGQIAIGASTTSLLSRLARALAPTLVAGDEIIVTDADHEANIGPWLRLQSQGVVIRWWRIRPDSMQLELDDLDALLTARTRLLCFTHASNLLGSALDIKAIAARARTAGARCCVDGVAYAPHRALAFAEWGVDWYAFSLYKVFGPHCAVLCSSPEGAGMLANLNHEWMQPSDAAGRLEAGAYPYELAWGAAAVPAYLEALGAHHGGSAFAAIEAHECTLTTRLLDWLAPRPGIRIIGAPAAGPGRLPTVSFVTSRAAPQAVVAHTDSAQVGIRHGHFYAPRLVEALGLERATGVVRVSLAHYNTLAEVERLISALDGAL